MPHETINGYEGFECVPRQVLSFFLLSTIVGRIRNTIIGISTIKLYEQNKNKQKKSKKLTTKKNNNENFYPGNVPPIRREQIEPCLLFAGPRYLFICSTFSGRAHEYNFQLLFAAIFLAWCCCCCYYVGFTAAIRECSLLKPVLTIFDNIENMNTKKRNNIQQYKTK